jgi:hypothetical protein
MKARESKLIIVQGCGEELLDTVLNTVNYECSSPNSGTVLVHTDDLDNTTDDSGRVQRIITLVKFANPKYEGLILLRK